MLIPNKVMVLGRVVPVEILPRTEFNASEGSDCIASYSGDTQTIRITEDIPDHLIGVSLLHEIVHAHFHLSGLSEFFTQKQEESVCLLMENLLGVFNEEGVQEVLKIQTTKNGRNKK